MGSNKDNNNNNNNNDNNSAKEEKKEEEQEEQGLDGKGWMPIVTCSACGEQMRVDVWNGPHIAERHAGDSRITCEAKKEDKDRAWQMLKKMQEPDENGISVTFLGEDGQSVRL